MPSALVKDHFTPRGEDRCRLKFFLGPAAQRLGCKFLALKDKIEF